MKKEIIDKLKEIRLIIFDLEGVLLTQSQIDEQIIDNLSKSVCNAVSEFKKRNVNFAIITARHHDELIESLEEIPDCHVLSSSIDKVSAAEKILKTKKLNCNNVFFIGDGILDIPLLRKCGLSAAPKSAKREVKRVVDFIINGSNSNEIFQEILKLFDKIKS
ncbi:MAG: HAD hydrolase family protein [Melioribacteraceae bacterium]